MIGSNFSFNRTVCYGCKTSFKVNQRLPLENLKIQYKNYDIPLKTQIFKNNLLKTIISFLNAKGGTIYIGIDDTTGMIRGKALSRKEMDEFKLVIKHMTEKIYPEVDLNSKEQISVFFVPVFEENGAFQGKYVVKFVVQQGDPQRLYCIVNHINTKNNILQQNSSSTAETHDVFLAYRRHNMGGIEEIKGTKLLHEMYLKSRSTSLKVEGFHEGCNPEPIDMTHKQKIDKSIENPIIRTTNKSKRSRSKYKAEKVKIENINSWKPEIEIERQLMNQSILNHPFLIKKQTQTTQRSQRSSHLDFTFNESHYQKEPKQEPESDNIFKMQTVFLTVSHFKQEYAEGLIQIFKHNIAIGVKKAIFLEDSKTIKVVFKSTEDQQIYLKAMKKPSINSHINKLALNEGLVIRTSEQKGISVSKDYRLKEQQIQQKNIPSSKKKPLYDIEFQNFQPDLLKKFKNYLENSINPKLQRTAILSKDKVTLRFKNMQDFLEVWDICHQKCHLKALKKYCGNNKVKISKRP